MPRPRTWRRKEMLLMKQFDNDWGYLTHKKEEGIDHQV